MTGLFCLLLVLPVCLADYTGIVHPCRMDDYFCIGENLAANSQCNLSVKGTLPSEYIIRAFPFETPYFNASYVDNNLYVRNLDKCFVSEFFYNMDTDNAVLAIRCRDLEFQSTRTLVQHYPEAEDVTYSYNYRGIYPEIILTVNLMPANNIDLCRSNTFAYVSALPRFIIDPNDQRTSGFLSTDLSYLNIFERETAEERADHLLRYFANEKLCNFGCN